MDSFTTTWKKVTSIHQLDLVGEHSPEVSRINRRQLYCASATHVLVVSPAASLARGEAFIRSIATLIKSQAPEENTELDLEAPLRCCPLFVRFHGLTIVYVCFPSFMVS
jgi:hypothetical protein